MGPFTPKTRTVLVSLMSIAFSGLMGHSAVTAGNANIEAPGSTFPLGWQTVKIASVVYSAAEQPTLHEKCIEAAEHAKWQAGAIVPGRTWT